MENRRLKYPPIVEHIFELRWSHPAGRASLYEEFRMAQGLYSKALKAEFPKAVPLPDIPREVFAHTPIAGAVMLRLTADAPTGYPMTQLGPGVLSLNHDKTMYAWTANPGTPHPERSVRSLAAKTITAITTTVTDLPLAERIESAQLRAIDFFPLGKEDPEVAWKERFSVEIASEVATMSSLSNATRTMAYRDRWVCPDGFVLEILLETGALNGEPGFLGQFIATGGKIDLSRPEDWLDRAHALSGDAFFRLLKPDFCKALKGTE